MLQTKSYIRTLFAEEDAILQSISIGLDERSLPQISVPAEIGKMLYMLAKMSKSKHILEIGALGGYSSIWLARSLDDMGTLTSIELEESHASFAKENIKQAGLDNKVTFLVGDAIEALERLMGEERRFDFFFIDADKPNYSLYLEKAIELATDGAVIVADNLFQEGRIFDEEDNSPSPVAIRQFNSLISSHPRLDSVIIPMGDGLGVCIVKG